MALRKWILTGALALIAAPVLAGDAGSFRQQFAAVRAQAFAQADADGDGALSPAEFQTFMQLMKQKRAELRFAKADANGDGKVTLAELEAAHPGRGCHHGGEQPPTGGQCPRSATPRGGRYEKGRRGAARWRNAMTPSCVGSRMATRKHAAPSSSAISGGSSPSPRGRSAAAPTRRTSRRRSSCGCGRAPGDG